MYCDPISILLIVFWVRLTWRPNLVGQGWLVASVACGEFVFLSLVRMESERQGAIFIGDTLIGETLALASGALLWHAARAVNRHRPLVIEAPSAESQISADTNLRSDQFTLMTLFVVVMTVCVTLSIGNWISPEGVGWYAIGISCAALSFGCSIVGVRFERYYPALFGIAGFLVMATVTLTWMFPVRAEMLIGSGLAIMFKSVAIALVQWFVEWSNKSVARRAPAG